ncbi:zinc-binding dehydrogenase [Anatilimnocola floriformis]|uniref:zinc-binding dehydrogenase n=1 Tax=Anatilimnocola floriformis TaxID=2948575 RepID=UPI0020C3B106|nr:zinc-binding dehydrogenase [Anatilimnocola floriformis]
MNSQAAVFEGTAREVHLRELSLPDLQSGETLVRVLGCTLCGSDLHSYEGHRKVPVPTVLGHEIVGEIISFGEGTPRIDLAGRELRIGDRVTWAIVANCGECFYCQRNLPQKCLQSVKYGHEAFRPGRELLGGLAEHCLLVRGTAIIRVPENLPLEVACPASCATSTVAAALEAAGELSGRTVGILGAGMLGLTVCAMSRTAGAAEVLCVDTNEARRAQAIAFGATHALTPDELANKVRELTDGHGLDILLEFTGSTPALENAWPLLRIGGRIVLVGAVFPGPPLSLVPEQIIRRQLTISGVHNYAPRHLAVAMSFLEHNQEKFPFASLVAAWRPLAETAEAFQVARESQAVRIGVRAET